MIEIKRHKQGGFLELKNTEDKIDITTYCGVQKIQTKNELC